DHHQHVYQPPQMQQQQYHSQPQMQQQHQPQMQQHGYASQHNLYVPPPQPRATETYDVGRLAGQAARLSLGSPTAQPAALPQMQQHAPQPQHEYSLGAPPGPQYQPSAPPAQSPHAGHQHHYAPPQQLPPQQPPQMPHQYQPQSPQHAQGHAFYAPPHSADPGYSPTTLMAQHASGPAAMSGVHADPYAAAAARRAGAPDSGGISHAAAPGHPQAYAGYAPAPAPAEPGPAGSYGVAGMPMSGPARAGSAHGSGHHAQFGGFSEAPVSIAATISASHAVAAQPMVGGYAAAAAAAAVYPQLSQGQTSSYTSVALGSMQQQQPPLYPAQHYMGPPAHTSPYQPPAQVLAPPPPHGVYAGSAAAYAVPAQSGGAAGYQQPAYLPTSHVAHQYHQVPVSQPHEVLGQGVYMQQAPPLDYQRHQQSPPPAHPPQVGYSYPYPAQHYAPVSSAPHVAMGAQPLAAPYGHGQPPPQPMQQPPAQQQQPQYQHGYGGNVGSLMD
ncbi:hypothetical protein IWQ56_005328, partial [Coemansia nantahalensis]